MAIGPRRPLFYIAVLSLGFVLGGFLSELLKMVLPEGSPAEAFFTLSVRPSVGPVHVDLLLFGATIGPLSLEVSLLSLVGVVLAYMLARSIF